MQVVEGVCGQPAVAPPTRLPRATSFPPASPAYLDVAAGIVHGGYWTSPRCNIAAAAAGRGLATRRRYSRSSLFTSRASRTLLAHSQIQLSGDSPSLLTVPRLAELQHTTASRKSAPPPPDGSHHSRFHGIRLPSTSICACPFRMRSYRRTIPLYLAINWVLLVVLVGATREKRDADAVRMRTHRGKASDW